MENFDVYTITGEEEFIDGNASLGFNMLDFWKFEYPNIYDMHGEIAEFLVAMALGKNKPDNKDYWTLYDMDYIDKTGRKLKIEVKSTAYYHAWQTEKSRISKQRTFSIRKSNQKSIENINRLMGLDYNSSIEDNYMRPSDVYIFCLNKGENRKDAYPLNVDNWEFYIVPTKVIDEKCGDNKTISLSRIQKMGYRPLKFNEIRNEVEAVSQSIVR